MPYSRLRENTASLWMTKDNTQPQFPLDGQGAITTSAASSLVADASEDNPVIIEAIHCEYVVGSDIFVNIREVSTTTDILQVRFKATTSPNEPSQFVQIGGPYGVRVNKPFRVRVNASGSAALPYSAGADKIGKITIFFRYA